MTNPVPNRASLFTSAWMELTSFPLSGNDDPHNRTFKELYGRMRTAASNVIYSFKSDDKDFGGSTSAKESNTKRKSTLSYSSNVSVSSITSERAIAENNKPSPASSVTNITPQPAATGRISSQTALPLSGSTASATLAPVSTGVSVQSQEPLLLQVLRRTGSVPSVEMTPGEDSEMDNSDNESLFSVASVMSSRELLANHYQRACQRTMGSLSKEFWMKDENATSCFGCNRPFTAFRRRHHCRVCGQIFCSSCSYNLDGSSLGQYGRRVRICKPCERSLESHDASGDEHDLASYSLSALSMGSLQDSENLQPRLYPAEVEAPQPRSFFSTHLNGHYHGKSLPHTGSASSPNIDEYKTTSTVSVIDGNSTRDNSPERPKTPEANVMHVPNLSHLSVATSPLTCGYRPRSNSSRSAKRVDALKYTLYPTSTAIFPVQTSVDMNAASLTYAGLFLDRILSDNDVSLDLHDQLLKPVLRVTATTPLEQMTNDRVSPRHYVKIKCLPGGNSLRIEYIHGTIFTQILARKRMPRHIENPSILLISFPLEYTRGAYTSLKPLIKQEAEYLRKLVARIVNLQPSLLLSTTHISGKALELLEKNGIATAQHVKATAIDRLARYTGADTLASIDRLSRAPRLGVCDLFEVLTYRENDVAKTFMLFDGTPVSGGCTLVIRGKTDNAHVIKYILEVMTDVCFSLKMETSLMRDQFVLIPPLPEILPDQVLSLSPFVDFKQPYFLTLSQSLEDRIVKLHKALAQTQKAKENVDSGEALELIKSYKMDLNLPGAPMTSLDAIAAIQEYQYDTATALWQDIRHQWTAIVQQNPAMNSPAMHQNLVLSSSLVYDNVPCVGPEQILIEFYLDTDQTLGQFVEETCLAFDEPCGGGCPYTFGEHRRLFVHGEGMLTFSISKETCKLPGMQDTILMWSYCKECDKTMPVTPMSPVTWKYSFGKYLELSFWGTPLSMRASVCRHNIYRDHIRYFGWRNLALSIDYKSITLLEIVRPSLEVKWDAKDRIQCKIETYRVMSTKINNFWTSLKEVLNSRFEDRPEARSRLDGLIKNVEEDRVACMNHLDNLYISLGPEEYLGLNSILHFAEKLVDKWHNELTELDGELLSEKEIRRTAQQLHLLYEAEQDMKSANSLQDNRDNFSQNDSSKFEPNLNANTRDQTLTPDTSLKKPEFIASNGEVEPLADHLAIPARQKSGANLTTGLLGQASNRFAHSSSSFVGKQKPLIYSSPLKSMRDAIQTPRVQFLAQHYEEITLEFERERERERERLHRRSVGSRTAQPVAEVFRNVEEALSAGRVIEKRLDETLDMGPNSGTEFVERKQEVDNEAKSSAASSSSETSVVPKEGHSLIRMLVKFWAERLSARWNGIEHILSPSTHLFSSSLVVVRENEPTSLIAFCLSLPDYLNRIESITSDSNLEQLMLSRTGTHLRYLLEDGTTTLSCKIFFSEQFHSLRRRCGCDENFVQSLSRCHPWNASGGKSGLSFLKTTDNRFIVKELSQAEFDSFASFAPSYFEYMTQALFHDLPTVLAKFLGFYQLQIQSASRQIKLYVLVMENLFYGRNFTRIYDLKGSLRNRRVAETGRADEVLLDENMVDYMYDNPLFVREHSKKLLRTCVYNDTLFLTKMNVMDYSLVIGMDVENKTIVAGIIDFVRTFTWDKKIESWVKGKTTTAEPTVVSPRQYKIRFRESMEQYFIMVPDCWVLLN